MKFRLLTDNSDLNLASLPTTWNDTECTWEYEYAEQNKAYNTRRLCGM